MIVSLGQMHNYFDFDIDFTYLVFDILLKY